ncbi:MAG: SH3 domain-containing protein [Spirochaetota bacterium]
MLRARMSICIGLLLFLFFGTACKEKDKETVPEGISDTFLWVTAKGGLHLRSRPSVSGKKLVLIPNGSRVDFLEQGKEQVISGKKGHWMKIRYAGKEGWSFGAYLTRKKIISEKVTNPEQVDAESVKLSKKLVTDFEYKMSKVQELEKTQPEQALQKYRLLQKEVNKALELSEDGKLEQEQIMQLDTIAYSACEKVLALDGCKEYPSSQKLQESEKLLQALGQALAAKDKQKTLALTSCMVTAGCYACDGGYSALAQNVIATLFNNYTLSAEYKPLQDGSGAYAFGDLVVYLANDNGYWEVTGFLNRGKLVKIEDAGKNTCQASFL